MDNPYQAPGENRAFAPIERAPMGRYAWLALNLVWGLLATFALAFSAWLLTVLAGFGRGWLH